MKREIKKDDKAAPADLPKANQSAGAPMFRFAGDFR